MIAGNEAPQRPEDSETKLARIGHQMCIRDRFYTVDKSRTKGGSGLGLYIVKELLKKIDRKIGNIEYLSRIHI